MIEDRNGNGTVADEIVLWIIRTALPWILGIGLALGFLWYFFSSNLDWWFKGIVLAALIGSINVGYWLGRKHAKREQAESDQRLLTMLSASVNVVTGQRVVAGRGEKVPPERPLVINNRQLGQGGGGIQDNIQPTGTGQYDYGRVLRDMVRFGYPYFTRDDLRAKGAFMGDNSNYTVLTKWLSECEMISRVSVRGDQAYEWANPVSGQRYGQRAVEDWIAQQYPT